MQPRGFVKRRLIRQIVEKRSVGVYVYGTYLFPGVKVLLKALTGAGDRPGATGLVTPALVGTDSATGTLPSISDLINSFDSKWRISVAARTMRWWWLQRIQLHRHFQSRSAWRQTEVSLKILSNKQEITGQESQTPFPYLYLWRNVDYDMRNLSQYQSRSKLKQIKIFLHSNHHYDNWLFQPLKWLRW